MISIIIYCYNNEHIQHTIDGILNTVPADLLSEILICNDGAGEINSQFDELTSNKRIGRAKSWNKAINKTSSDTLIFINQCSKFSDSWVFDVIKELDENPNSIVSPAGHKLNTQLWSSNGNKVESYKIDWGLTPIESNDVETILAIPACFAIKKDRLLEIGGFDNGMEHGAGVITDISLKNILLGGNVKILKSCSVSSESVPCQPNHKNTIANNARIAETWLDEYAYRYYDFIEIDKNAIDTGSIAACLDLKQQQQYDIKWLVSKYIPGLSKIYDLQNIANNKSIAIICDGPSIDSIDKNLIFRNHLVIGIDYMGLHYDCDYVITLAANVVNDLLEKYSSDQIIVPNMMYSGSGMDLASHIDDGLTQFDIDEEGSLPEKIRPPFCNFKSPVHCAVHIAAFMGADNIVLYGSDNKIIDDKSHTTKIEFYNNGRYWANNENTSKIFTFYEQGLDSLGKLLIKNNIKLLRMNYV